MTKQLVCKLDVLQPQPSTTVSETQLEVELPKYWLLAESALTKIGCVKSFAVKCAHKCNFLRINTISVENKCNSLTFLRQQKLALIMRHTAVLFLQQMSE